MIQGGPVKQLHLRLAASLLLCLTAGSGCAAFPWSRPEPAQYDAAQARAQYRRTLAEQAQPAIPETPAQKLAEGGQLEQRGDLQRAMLAYFEAASLAPQELEPRLRLAHLQMRTNPTQAQRSFQTLIDQRPKAAAAWFGLGLAHLSSGELSEARAAIGRSIELGPQTAAAQHSALGAVYDRLGEQQLAQDALRRGLEAHPDDPMLLNNLAVSHLISGEAALAEPLLRRALATLPDDQALRNNLGLAVGLLGQYAAALDLFRRGGDEQAALNNLGYVYFLKGRASQAIETYERALLVGGDHELEILANLRRALDEASLDGGDTGTR
jgi:Flp pilus assembly protein TadD